MTNQSYYPSRQPMAYNVLADMSSVFQNGVFLKNTIGHVDDYSVRSSLLRISKMCRIYLQDIV